MSPVGLLARQSCEAVHWVAAEALLSKWAFSTVPAEFVNQTSSVWPGICETHTMLLYAAIAAVLMSGTEVIAHPPPSGSTHVPVETPPPLTEGATDWQLIEKLALGAKLLSWNPSAGRSRRWSGK